MVDSHLRSHIELVHRHQHVLAKGHFLTLPLKDLQVPQDAEWIELDQCPI
jgi:hypothetical protein